MPKNNCAICAQKMKSFITTTRCDHKFHNKCIRKWYGIQSNGGRNVTCPMCRESLKSDMKNEIRMKGRDVLNQLSILNKQTIDLFFFLMKSRAKTAQEFRNSLVFGQTRYDGYNHVNRNNINNAMNYNIFVDVSDYVMLGSDKRLDTPEITKYVQELYLFIKKLLLFHKNVFEIFPTQRVVLRIDNKDIMTNRYLIYVYNLIGWMVENRLDVNNAYKQRKPKQFHELFRLFKSFH